MGLQENLQELARRNEEALLGGGADKIQKQHEMGKLTAVSVPSCCLTLERSSNWIASRPIARLTSGWIRRKFLVTV